MSKKSQKHRKSRKIPSVMTKPSDDQSEREVKTRSLSQRTIAIIVLGIVVIIVLFITKPSQAPLPGGSMTVTNGKEPATTKFNPLDINQLGPVNINPSSLNATPFLNPPSKTSLQK